MTTEVKSKSSVKDDKAIDIVSTKVIEALNSVTRNLDEQIKKNGDKRAPGEWRPPSMRYGFFSKVTAEEVKDRNSLTGSMTTCRKAIEESIENLKAKNPSEALKQLQILVFSLSQSQNSTSKFADSHSRQVLRDALTDLGKITKALRLVAPEEERRVAPK